MDRLTAEILADEEVTPVVEEKLALLEEEVGLILDVGG
jgi:hypothetical protein